jgi:hypothetical protein
MACIPRGGLTDCMAEDAPDLMHLVVRCGPGVAETSCN